MTAQEPLTHDPERTFGQPRNIVEDSSLSTEQKLEILESWRADLIELQVAESENMPCSSPETDAGAERLVEVAEAIRSLRGEA